MATTMPQAAPRRHRLNLETRPVLAKARLKKVERADRWAATGRFLSRALDLCGWSQERLAQELAEADGEPEAPAKRRAQVSRWVNGTEGLPFYLVWGLEEFRPFLILAQAEQVTGQALEIETTIRVRRLA